MPLKLSRVEGVTGIDNCAAIFESDSLSVTVETKSFSFSPSPKYSLDTFSNLAKKRDFKRVKTKIGGRKAVIVTFDEPENAKGFKYLSLVSIAAVDGFRIYVAMKNAQDRNVAEQIFRSVRFVN